MTVIQDHYRDAGVDTDEADAGLARLKHRIVRTWPPAGALGAVQLDIGYFANVVDINGQGIALARTTLAAWDLLNGRLMRPFAEALRLSRTYWIFCPKAVSNIPKVATFRNWVLAEATEDARRLKALAP